MVKWPLNHYLINHFIMAYYHHHYFTFPERLLFDVSIWLKSWLIFYRYGLDNFDVFYQTPRRYKNFIWRVVQTCIKLLFFVLIKMWIWFHCSMNYCLSQCSSHSSYLQFLDQSLSRCLFEWVSRAIREFFTHIRAVIGNLGKNPSSVTYMVGLVTRIHEKTFSSFPWQIKLHFADIFYNAAL